MNVLNFFEFLKDKEGRRIPGRAKLMFNPNYIVDINDFVDEDGNVDLGNNGDPDYPYRQNNITFLPDNLTVKGNLYLSFSPIKLLPDNLTVGGGLYLSFCENLQSLPNNLTVNGTLDLEYCISLQSLPKDLKVGGTLAIIGTPLSEKYTAEEIKQIYPGVKGNILGAKRK